MRDKRYPLAQQQAAERFGKFVAWGLLTREEVVAQLVASAVAAGYPHQTSGLQTHLSGIIVATARDWELRMGEAEAAVRKAIAPWLRAGHPTRPMLDAAMRAAAGMLTADHIRVIVLEETAWWVRWRQQDRASVG